MTDGYEKGFPVSWDQFHRDARALAWRLAELGRWRSVVAVTRGGMVPAAIVARELDIRLVDTVCISSYDHKSQRAAKVLKSVPGDGADASSWTTSRTPAPPRVSSARCCRARISPAST